MIPYGRQAITKEDVQSVVDVLQSDYLTQGPQVPLFEQAIGKLVKAKYAVAVNSATSALHIACYALGLKTGDWLWTTPITFVASANCGRLCGASIDFVDIDPVTYTLCPIALRKKLEQAQQNNCLPKVVIPVHLCGHSCDMYAIKKLSIEYKFFIIEDASHAIGAHYNAMPVGCCYYSDITVFSFHPVKIITTAEGGVATTNQSSLAEKMSLYRNHGITRKPESIQARADGPWYYEQQGLGQNYRLTDIQAALGISQLSRLKDIIKKRRHLVSCYNQALDDLPLNLPSEANKVFSSCHLYVIRLQLSAINHSKKDIFEMLIQSEIGVNVHYIPVYKQPYYQQWGFSKTYCENAESYYSEAISLPLFPELTEKNQRYIITTLKNILKA